MKKYKVCVYAISKNESQFVNRWVDSMSEADGIFVLDTGSTDDTIKLLQNRNVIVKQKMINPWRFDVARNESLKLIPNDFDICVCTDLDEVFTKGWKKELLKHWQENTTQMAYNYIWNFDSNNNPGVTFYIQKAHANGKFHWVNPVHEVLEANPNVTNNLTYCDTFTLKHYPDTTKSRSSYLPLLELSVKENPDNDRNVHYLGREYMYYQEWNKAIDTLHKHLKLKSSTWKDERAASMRYIARSYLGLNRQEEAIMWYQKAIEEAPYLREAYTELGYLYYTFQDYSKAITYLEQALNIKEKPKTYICEPYAYNETIYDLLSISYYYQNDFSKAYKNAQIAFQINPTDQRIKNNLEIFKKLPTD